MLLFQSVGMGKDLQAMRDARDKDNDSTSSDDEQMEAGKTAS